MTAIHKDRIAELADTALKSIGAIHAASSTRKREAWNAVAELVEIARVGTEAWMDQTDNLVSPLSIVREQHEHIAKLEAVVEAARKVSKRGNPLGILNPLLDALDALDAKTPNVQDPGGEVA
jgi:hypothetical protein